MKNLLFLIISLVFCISCTIDEDAAKIIIKSKTPRCYKIQKIDDHWLDTDYYASTDSSGNIFLWTVSYNGLIKRAN